VMRSWEGKGGTVAPSQHHHSTITHPWE
jgi:hypothetical protein